MFDTSFLRAVHVDDRNGDLYFGRQTGFGRQNGGLYKLASGATAPLEIVTDANPFGLDIDPLENRVYWTNVELDKIQSSRLDGTDVRDIITDGINLLGGLTLDLAAQKIYWADQLNKTINRANFDGTGCETVISLQHIPFAVEVVSVPETSTVWASVCAATVLLSGRHRRNGRRYSSALRPVHTPRRLSRFRLPHCLGRADARVRLNDRVRHFGQPLLQFG